MSRRELLIGCGRDRARRVGVERRRGWESLTTLDHNADHKPDVVHDLEQIPYPFDDDTFDEVHAYEVLEHLGQQGDYRAFFAQFEELWRVLKPGGYLAATCPSWRSLWAWGDPSHRRILCTGSLVFLDQQEYRSQVDGIGPDGQPWPRSPMSDFRFCYRGDFEGRKEWVTEDAERFVFVLRAVKPSRWHQWAPGAAGLTKAVH